MKLKILVLVGLCSGLLAGETFNAGDWTLTGGGNAALTLSYKGRKLLSDVTLGGWTDDYKRGTFGGRGYSVRREGDTVTFSKTGPNANVKLVVTLAEGRAAFAMDVDILKEFGPVEYGFHIPVDSFAAQDGSAWPMVDRTFCLITPGQKFESAHGRRLAFEYPESQYALTVLEGNPFALQDMRHKGSNYVRFIGSRRSTEPCRMSWKHEWTVNESFDAEARTRRRIQFGRPRQRLVPVEFSNPGFEDGAAGWSLPKKAAYDGTVAHSGKGSVCLRVDDPKTDSCYVTRQVPVKAGARYRASCFVKAEDVRDVEGRMPSVGAGLIVEWADKDGKWCGSGEYACGIFGTSDWRKVECRSLMANQRAAYANFYLAVRGAGRAWFDDVTLIHDEVSADKFEPLDGAELADNTPFFTWRPHRGARRYMVELSRDPAFGKGTVRSYDAGGIAEFQLAEPLEPGVWYWRVLAKGLEDPQPWRFTQTAPVDRDCLPPSIIPRGARVCASDQSFTVRVKEKNPREMSIAFAVNGADLATGSCAQELGGDEALYRFAPPAGGWPKGLTEGKLVAKDAAGNVATRRFWLLNAPKPANSVVVSKDGFYEQAGKRIFPLGIYEVAPKYMEEVRKAGFDVVHTYRWEGDQNDVACRAYLDACWAADGLRAFIGFDRGTRSQDGIVQGNFAHIARRVGALADHAGLFCWYLFDEPEIANQFVSPDLLTALADLVRELDPYHPVVMTTWNETMNEYRRTWDTHWSQAYGNPAGVVRQIAEHRKFLKNASPITLLVNCNDQKQGAARRRGIEPDLTRFSRDYAHLRACAMLGIVEECNGLWWWWFARDCRDFYTAAQNPKAWADLIKVVQELVSLRPVVNAPGRVRTGCAGEEKCPVEWWAKDIDGRTVVIVVNTSEKSQKVDIDVGGSVGKLSLELARYEVQKLEKSPVAVHGEGANRVATVDISGCGDGKAMWKLIGEAQKAEPGGRIILTGKRPGAIYWGIPGTGYPYAETAAECAAAVDFYLGRTEKPGAKAAAKAALASVPEVVYVTHAAFQTDHHNTATIFQCGEINERSYRTQGALKAWNPATGTTRVIVPEKEGRTIRDPEVDWDGKRIVFSMRDGRTDDYHIYVVNADGTDLRQLTRAKGVSDIDPAFLPDGDIVFSSTRDPKYCMCNRHIMCNLYRMEADGANIHQIGVSTLFEGHSSILPDGRVLYDRWEYVDRDFGDAQGLWTCNPDGTRHAIWWGNNTTSPGGVINARAVGGDSSKAIAILGSCHDRPWGALGLIDRSRGVDGQEPVLRTWPASYRAHIHAGAPEDFDSTRFLACKYADPFPIDETRFLAVRMTGRAGEMALVYLDLDGNETELLADAPGIWSPVILRPTKKPVVQSQQRNFDAPDAPGKFYLQNVYIGTHMQGVKPGTVKALRVVESPPKRNWTGPRGWFGHGEEAAAMNWHSFENKRILGTVSVEADGSAYFEVPGNTFVYFQALDEKGKMVQSMRSGVNVQPGETYGCVGCHEKRVGEAAPVTERPLAMQRPPSKMNGWYGPARLFSFQKEVQPVFTKNCLKCHDYGTRGGKKLNLSGDRGAFFCTSYVDLWATGAIKCIGGGPAEIQPAYSWGSHASKLTRTLYGHGKTKLTDEERDRVITWMDVNAVYYPRYECAYPDNPGGRMPISFAEQAQLEKLCGTKIENTHSKRQREQLNFDRPELSRILESVKGEKREEALTIIRKGAERLKATPRGDVEEGFTPCAKDREREARSERRRAEERRVYEAIRAGKKVYDE